MRRDMDLIRDLLLKIEGGQKVFEILPDDAAEALGVQLETPMSREEAERLEGHLNLLKNAGYIEVEMRAGDGTIMVGDITWAGHDFIDAVREPKVWTETKSRAEKVGGWTVAILADLAKGYLKAEAAKHGFPMV